MREITEEARLKTAPTLPKKHLNSGVTSYEGNARIDSRESYCLSQRAIFNDES